MNWLAWRQHRKQFLITALFFIGFAVYMIPSGFHFWHTYQYALSTCKQTATCGQLSNDLFQSSIDQTLLHLINLGIYMVPIILGLFWGVPFIAREYNEGTNKLVWTQSISRKKWLTIKLLWILVGAAITGAIFAGLNTWWFRAYNALNLSRFSNIDFSTQGFVLIGCSVFAVSLGIFFGALIKRTMAALGVTLFLLIAVVLVIIPTFIRPYYETPATYDQPLIGAQGAMQSGPGQASPNSPFSNSAILMIHGTIISSSGQPLDWANPPKQCIRTAPAGPIGSVGNVAVRKHAVVAPGQNGTEALASQNGGPTISINCIQTLGYKMQSSYQPSYRYWDFQRIETGLYLAASILPIAGTYWLVIKRDA